VEEEKPQETGRPGSYVPPNKRGGRYEESAEKQVTTLRVNNMSDSVTEDDLRDVFGRHGYISRVYLARDRDTGDPKGFAYVTFDDRRSAEVAKEKTVGVGVDGLIWAIDWARS
jgi:translation initiation factor 3 subunit G